MEAGSWKLEAGSWELEVHVLWMKLDSRKTCKRKCIVRIGIQVFSFELKQIQNLNLEVGSNEVDVGSWKLEAGSWKLFFFSEKLEVGSWKFVCLD